MNAHRSLSELLEIENDPAILSFRCQDTGLLLWPLLRNQMLRVLSESMYYEKISTAAPAPAGRHRAALRSLPATLWANARGWNGMRGDILVMASGAGHFRRGGMSFNRITDYFALENVDRTVTIEGLVDWQLPQHPANPRTYFFLPWQGRIDLEGRLRMRAGHVSQAAALVAFAQGRAQALGLGIPAEKQHALTTLVSRKIARLPAMLAVYRRLLRKVRPRLVLLEQACYSDWGVFNLVAREMGVRVAEPQHGLISRGHDAYNYAEALRLSPEFRRYLPHDLLGYGRWWCEQVNVPVEKHVIGHPHYVEQRASASPGAGNTKRDVLFLSDGFEFDRYLALARALQPLVGERLRPVVRPHPLERQRVHARFPTDVTGDVAIDRERDIYPALGRSAAVVSEVSTGLFEAVGLADRVLMWATPKSLYSCPERPFDSFTDAEDLARKLLAPAAPVPSADVEAIWASDWRGNYRRYVERVLAGPRAKVSEEALA